MKKVYILITAIIFAFSAQAQNFLWAKAMGGTTLDQAYAVALDASGNVYTAGFFSDVVDFDPGPGVSNLISAGGTDIFISKLDASGNFIWAKSMGGTGDDRGYSIAIDGSGNIFTTGDYTFTADFDPNGGVFNMTTPFLGAGDIFISKLDASGNFVWAKSIGGGSIDTGFDITVDASGNVYTTGFFFSTVDFDPNGPVYNLFGNGTDIFVCKLDNSGNLVWAKNMGGTGVQDIGESIAVDLLGNVYTTGYFWSSAADFDPGPGVFNLTSVGVEDIFVSKLDNSGNFVWAKQMGGTGDDLAYSIAVDAANNVYTTGSFENTADFDPSAAVVNLTSAGLTEIYVNKLDGAGNFVWAKQMGGGNYEVGFGLTLDAAGNVYTTGGFYSTTDFDPSGATYNLNSNGLYDVFVSKLDNSGNFVWAESVGAGGTNDFGRGITLDASNNVYFTGYYGGTIDFNPQAGILDLTSNGQDDIFIEKLASCSSVPAAPGTISGTATICSGSSNTYSIAAVAGATSYTWTLPGGWTGVSTTNSITTTASSTSGNITVTANNACGNSSAQTLAVTVNSIPATPGTISGTSTICSGSSNTYSIATIAGATSYTWTLPGGFTGVSTTNSITTTAGSTSGNITVTANNTCGNSSAQTLAVTVNSIPATPGTISGSSTICSGSSNTYSIATIAGATSYTWTLPGGWTGASIANSITTTATAAGGNVIVVANNTCGASAPQTLTVTVNPLPTVNYSQSPSVVCINATAVVLGTASPTGGTFSGTAVTGSTFDASVAGLGTYIITYSFTDVNSCSNSSSSTITVDACTKINTVTSNQDIIVYPNPASNIVYITNVAKQSRVSVVNILGEIVYTIESTSPTTEIDLSNFQNGIYFIQLQNENTILTKKIVKE